MVPTNRDKDNRHDQVELIRILRAHLPELRERFGVRTLALFGSYARGEAGEESDLDVLVEFERVPGLIAFVELEQYLGDLVGVRVDLVLRDALRPAIGQRILKELVPV